MFPVFGLMTCFRGPVHRRLRHGLCNAPFEDLEHAINAVRTGREFRERALAVSARWEQKFGVRIRKAWASTRAQMCAIGRGLMGVPRLLMLDEPSCGSGSWGFWGGRCLIWAIRSWRWGHGGHEGGGHEERRATFWINHDKPQSDGLRYAPAYYE